MLNGSVQFNEFDSFKQANSLLKNASGFDGSFEQALEAQIKETTRKTQDKAVDSASEAVDTKKNKTKETHPDTLPDITKITRDTDRNTSEVGKTYALLDKMKDKKKYSEEEQKGPRQQVMDNANFAGQAMFQPVNDQAPRQRASKSKMLSAWEKYAPMVTEDLTKKAVRIDIPLLNDVQALVLRMNPDRSLTASLLGSYAMGELIKQNKDKLDRNLRHHQLSLREFNTYRSELEFTSESGTRKSKKKPKLDKKKTADIM